MVSCLAVAAGQIESVPHECIPSVPLPPALRSETAAAPRAPGALTPVLRPAAPARAAARALRLQAARGRALPAGHVQHPARAGSAWGSAQRRRASGAGRMAGPGGWRGRAGGSPRALSVPAGSRRGQQAALWHRGPVAESAREALLPPSLPGCPGRPPRPSSGPFCASCWISLQIGSARRCAQFG